MIAKDPALDRRIWMLAWPLLLSNITAPLLGLVDTAVVGHLDSPVYLAAVALGSNVFMFLYFSFNFLRMGTTGFTSQARGAGEATLVVLLRALLLSTLVGSALILLRPLLSDAALWLLGGSDEVQRTIVAGIVAVARKIGVGVIAEYVEDAETGQFQPRELTKKLLFRLPTDGFRLTYLGVIHDENVICKIP